MSKYSNRPMENTFTISSDRLKVEVVWPGSSIQKGARFDLSGHIVQVTLDGRHVFCAPEASDADRGSGGLGLCNEFQDISCSMYNEAMPGEKFPKMGVGLLTRKTEEDYFFMTHYEKVPYPIEVSVSDRFADFLVQPVECLGYAARIEKSLCVDSNNLLIKYFFVNTGSRPIEVLEYDHNFICIDNNPIGPDYSFRLPYEIKMDKIPDVLLLNGREITWKKIPEEAFYCLPKGYEGMDSHMWELVYKPGNVGVREYSNFPAHNLAFWGLRHVASPEVFIKVNLNPGESLGWSRRYEFFCA